MIRVAIVGTGAIARGRHIAAIGQQAHRAVPVAAMDVNGEAVAAFCDEHRIPKSYTDLDEMLAAEGPDVVHVCTPPYLHAEQVVRALEAGAWVICEKPPCLSLAEYDRISLAERETGRYASFVFQHRFGSGARHLRELLAAGTLGRPLVVQCVTAWFRDQAYFDVPWRAKWDTEGGGPTMGHGIHQIDTMLSILGDWSEIQAMLGRVARCTETEDVSLAMVRFENGAMGTVVNSLLSPREESYLRFDFEKATVELRHLYGYSNANWTSNSELWSPEEDVPSGLEVEYSEFLDAFEAGVRPVLSGDEGRQSLEFVAGLYASAFTGQLVRRADLTPDNPFYTTMNGGSSL